MADDDTLDPSESTDSDEVRNDDGDAGPEPERPAHAHRGQISGAPEDGDSLFG